MTVFRARGYEAAGMAELLATMGIGRKSLYDTFGNKRELFLKAVRRYAAAEADGLEAALAKPGSPMANVTAAVAGVAKVHGCAGAVGCGVGNSIADFTDADPEAAAVLRGLADTNRKHWGRALRRAGRGRAAGRRELRRPRPHPAVPDAGHGPARPGHRPHADAGGRRPRDGLAAGRPEGLIFFLAWPHRAATPLL